MGVGSSMIVIEVSCEHVGSFAFEVGDEGHILVKEFVQKLKVLRGFLWILRDCCKGSEAGVNCFIV